MSALVPDASPMNRETAMGLYSRLENEMTSANYVVRQDPTNLLPGLSSLSLCPTLLPHTAEVAGEEEERQEYSCSTLHHSSEVWDPSISLKSAVHTAFRQGGPSIPYQACFPCFEEGVGVLYRLVNFSYASSPSDVSASFSPPSVPIGLDHILPIERRGIASPVWSTDMLHTGDGARKSLVSSVGSRDSAKRLLSQTWAFYNDTADTLVHVVAKFGAESQLTALGNTRLTTLPEKKRHAGSQTHPLPPGLSELAGAVAGVSDGVVGGTGGSDAVSGSGGSGVFYDAKHQKTTAPVSDPTWMYQATLDILPCETQLFLEGVITSFSLDIHTEALPAENVVFQNGMPTVSYHKVYPCFKRTGNGLLFRLVNMVEEVWYFYNDTKEYNMRVVVDFAIPMEIEPLGDTVLLTREEPTVPCLPSSLALNTEHAQTSAMSSENGTGLSTPRSSCTTAMGPGVEGFSVATTQLLWDPACTSPSSPRSLSSPCQITSGGFGGGEEGGEGWPTRGGEEYIAGGPAGSGMHGMSTRTTMVPVSQYPNGCCLQLSIPPGVTAAFIRGNPTVYKLEVVADICVPTLPHGTPEEQGRSAQKGGNAPSKEDTLLTALGAVPFVDTSPSPSVSSEVSDAYEKKPANDRLSLGSEEERRTPPMEWKPSREGERIPEGGSISLGKLSSPASVGEGVGETLNAAFAPPSLMEVKETHFQNTEGTTQEGPGPAFVGSPSPPSQGVAARNGTVDLHSASPFVPSSLSRSPFSSSSPSQYVLQEGIPVVPPPTSFPPPFLHGVPDPAIIPNISGVIPCFQDHGNGLLFRLVDDNLDIWAFYNDTVHLVMTAVVEIPLAASENVKLAPGVQVERRTVVSSSAPHMPPHEERRVEAMVSTSPQASASPLVEEVLITTVQIRPLMTAPFLVNAPPVFDTFFSAMTLEEEQQMLAQRQ